MKQDRLKEFLREHGSEVINMLFTKFNLDKAKQIWIEEAEERGKLESKRLIAIKSFDMLDLETILKITGLTIKELKRMEFLNKSIKRRASQNHKNK